MSIFQELKQELEECMCPECQGTGIVNDADPGDTCFEEFKCSNCNGTGVEPGCIISLDIDK